jgi:hypothetical protein
MALKIAAVVMKGELEAIAKSDDFANAPPGKALRMLHDEAFAACEQYSEDEFGYGPARVYRFRDGSLLVDDGRGYTCEDKATKS